MREYKTVFLEQWNKKMSEVTRHCINLRYDKSMKHQTIYCLYIY